MTNILFSPAERRGIIVFLIICMLLYLSVDAYLSHLQLKNKPSNEQIEAFRALVLEHKVRDSLHATARNNFKGLLDPNEVGQEQLLQSGLRKDIAERLIRFREKGAYYNSRSDLEKVYGMDTSWLNRKDLNFVFHPRKGEFDDSYEVRNQNLSLKLTPFDPNTISKGALLGMHLPGSAIQGILSFREKFRPFEKATDLYAVYNIDSSLAEQIIPFLKIKELAELNSLDSLIVSVSINQADTNLLKGIKGIGSYLAKSIVEYRQKLGGYYSVEQLRDLFVVDSSRYQTISKHLYCDDDFRKLDINKASEEELYNHPYISYKLARNIVEFRERMRLFEKVEELANIELVDGVLFSKLAPYLEIK